VDALRAVHSLQHTAYLRHNVVLQQVVRKQLQLTGVNPLPAVTQVGPLRPLP
jgi:hypothetical protein